MQEIVEHLQARVREQQCRLSLHAEKEREADQLLLQEIVEAVLSDSGTIIENYPDDPRGPSCLLLGCTREGRPIHMVCGHLHEEVFVVITIYRPDPEQWVNWRTRKEPG